MDPYRLLDSFYDDTPLRTLLRTHSEKVAEKALGIARALREDIDTTFLFEICILHDIGIYKTHAPPILCTGKEPYIRHGILGATMLKKEGYPRHAQALAHHVGVGLSKDEIISKSLPLPHEDLCPTCIEEELLTYADLFYSKAPHKNHHETSLTEVRRQMAGYGQRQQALFEAFHSRFTTGTHV